MLGSLTAYPARALMVFGVVPTGNQGSLFFDFLEFPWWFLRCCFCLAIADKSPDETGFSGRKCPCLDRFLLFDDGLSALLEQVAFGTTFLAKTVWSISRVALSNALLVAWCGAVNPPADGAPGTVACCFVHFFSRVPS